MGEGERISSKHIEMMMMIGMIGMLCLSIIPIQPVSGQSANCWQKIADCIGDNLNSSDPKFNANSPSFDKSELFCCPLMQQTAFNDKECFCFVAPLIRDNPNNSNYTELLNGFIFCNITDSLSFLETFCGVNSPPPSPPPGQLPPPSGLSPPAPASDSPASPGHSPSNSGKKKKKLITAIAVSSAGALVLIALGIILCTVRAKKKPHAPDSGFVRETAQAGLVHAPPPPPPGPIPKKKDDIITHKSLQYEFGALKTATNDFSDDHEIGRGGFGVVYKGTLPNGKVVAVKRLSRGSWQGDKEFKNEAALVAKLQHRNLVKLMGFCLDREERLLVYEFMPNKGLDLILFDPDRQMQLNWTVRYNIIRGIARGLLYLHEDSPTRIIHRDLKASNILLDGEMNPKIADFGMAKTFHVEQTHGDTSRIIGTYGYMAPEYLVHGQFSIKSDVYSFGVLVLEIISGKRVTSSIYQFGSSSERILSNAWKCFRDGRPLDFMDPKLRDSYSKAEIIRCIHIGLLCVQEDMRNRPTMGEVAIMFNSDSDAGSLLLPQYPGVLSTTYGEQSITSNTSSVAWSGSDPISEPRVR